MTDKLLFLLLCVTRQVAASLLCSEMGPCDRLMANGIRVSSTQIRLLSFLVPVCSARSPKVFLFPDNVGGW